VSRWVKSVIFSVCPDVRFTPNSDRLLHCHKVTLCAINDQSAAQQNTGLLAATPAKQT
jgi:hypothetical protein